MDLLASRASPTSSHLRPLRPFAVSLTFALALAVSPAFAQSDATKKQAQALQVEGVRLMQRGDNRAALGKFDEAFRLVPSPKILFNRGKAHNALGETLDALVDF